MPQQLADRKQFTRLSNERLTWPLAVLALFLACIGATQPTFFTGTNLISLVYYTCLLIPAVLGVHLLIVLGLFDLSIGSVAAASAVVAAKAFSSGASPSTAVLVALGVGVLFGLLNWFLVTKLGISALIGTLISMGAARATAVGITSGVTIGGLPNSFGTLVQSSSMAFPHAVVFGIFLVAALEVLSERHVLFRRFYQAGSNRTAAVECGINVSLIDCLAFVISGFGAAVVGLLQASRTLSAAPQAFPDLALDCIAACVIGGDSLSGGSGRALGAFVGMLMIVVSRNLVSLAGVSVYWQDLAISGVLLGAALLNRSKRGE